MGVVVDLPPLSAAVGAVSAAVCVSLGTLGFRRSALLSFLDVSSDHGWVLSFRAARLENDHTIRLIL